MAKTRLIGVKRKNSEPEPEASPDRSAIPESSVSDASERVGLPIKDGAVQWDQMRPTTRERVLKALSTSPPPGSPIEVSRALVPVCVMLTQTIGAAAMAIVMRAGYPPENARVMLFTSDEQRAIGEQFVLALNEWELFALMKYPATITLGLSLAGLLGTKAMGLQKPARVYPMGAPQASDQPS